MDLALFDRLAPVCPRCLHTAGHSAPLCIAERGETRGTRLWHGILHCTRAACWTEYPVIDAVPILTPDPAATLRASAPHATPILPGPLASLIGDALGPASPHDTVRQHLSLYAASQFPDWSGGTARPDILGLLDSGLAAAPPLPDGAVLDLGTGTGRGTWALAAATGRPVLGGDLNLPMLRLAQTLLTEGRATVERRRIGLVYDRTDIVLPASAPRADLDFWAMDALALPFAPEQFALTAALNLLDCVASPTGLVHEIARVTAPGAAALIATPFDWQPGATAPEGWMGGHSQRGSLGGAAEPVLAATLAEAGLTPLATSEHQWRLPLHARAEMHYHVHLCTARRQSRA